MTRFVFWMVSRMFTVNMMGLLSTVRSSFVVGKICQLIARCRLGSHYAAYGSTRTCIRVRSLSLANDSG